MIKVNYIERDELAKAGYIHGFENPSQFLKEINLPKEMKVGEEFIPETFPILVLQRETTQCKEFFRKPLFRVTKKIRLQFHWEGIKVVGSSMEEPNKFVFQLPRKKGEYRWYFKIICCGDAKPGLKPLYISIDTLHENILLKWALKLFKTLSLLALVSFIVLGIFYREIGLIDNIFFKEIFSNETMIGKTLSPLLIVLILLIAFWKNISNTFETLYKIESPPLDENLKYKGVKGYSKQYGIKITDSNNNFTM